MANTIKGILGHKLGMTQVFDEATGSSRSPSSLPARSSSPPSARPRPTATARVQFAFGAIDPRKVNKPVAGHFAKAGVTPRRHIAELRTEDVSGYRSARS